MIYAGFWRRFVAKMIDQIIICIPWIAIAMLLQAHILGQIVGVLIGIFYFPLFEASSLKATPGKAIMNMAVLTEAGSQLSIGQAFIRFFTGYLSGAILCIGYLMNLFTEKRQTLHDMIA